MMVKDFSSQIAKIGLVRKSIPLPLRQGYGWIKRKIDRHWLWESKQFQDYFDFIQKSQWWSLAELEAYQLEQLKELVKFAYEKVPYYQQSFKEIFLHPSDIKTLDDLQLIPLITKEIVRDNTEAFIPTGVDQTKLRMWVTGGTSGMPIKVYHDLYYCSMIEEAFSLRQRLWCGYKQYDRKVTLTRVPNKYHGLKRCWDYNNDENEIILSSFDMTEEHMADYVAVINQFKPRIIDGYPSALETFARFIIRSKAALHPVQAIFCGTEALFPGQRVLIESAFNCKIFSSYGMSERVADATECEQHNGYHVSMEYGILELLDKDYHPIKEPGISGAVVGTGFHNNVMPLIRYQMYDVGVFAGEKCACKRNLTLMKPFQGRVREYFVGKSGKLMSLQLIWAGRHPVWSKIREMQFVQERKGEVVAKIVRAPKFPDSEVTQELLEEVKKILTEDEFNIQFEFVDQMTLTHRGKLNFLLQKLPIGFDEIKEAGY